VRLSANAGIYGDLKGGEYEAEGEHWYLRGSEKRLQGNTGICEDLTGTAWGHTVGVGQLKSLSSTARTHIAYAVWRITAGS
jgi:hypothetical protein